MSATQALTPGRTTRLRVNIPERVVTRPTLSCVRYGPMIVERRDSATRGQMMRLPSGHLVPKPLQLIKSPADPDLQANIIKQDRLTCINDLAASDAVSILQASSAAAARTQLLTMLGGLAEETLLSMVGLPYSFYKSHPAGGVWDQELAADASAFPKPTYTDTIPLDRILVGKDTYAANQGFVLRFFIAGLDYVDVGCLMRFYFGGQASVTPSTAKGGEFCIAFYGDGRAELHERWSDGWNLVSEFQWSDIARVGGEQPHNLIIMPHGRSGLDVICGTGQARNRNAQGVSFKHSQHLWKTRPAWGEVSFDASEFGAEYDSKASMTGAGTIRMDVRRDLAPFFMLQWLGYPSTATIEDHAFAFPAPLPADATVYISLDTYIPPTSGGAAAPSLTASVYDAQTGAALAQAGGTPAGVQGFVKPAATRAMRVQVQASMPPVPNPPAIPVLYGISAWANGQARTVGSGQDITIRKAPGQKITITGPDLYPGNETAALELDDSYGEITALTNRGRITSQIITNVPTGPGATQDVILFQGEIPRPEASHEPIPMSPNRRVRALRMVGWSARLSDSMFWCQQQFSRATADYDPAGYAAGKPWRLTDMIRWGLEQAGVQADQMDVPTLETRWYISGTGSTERMLLQPGVKILDWVMDLVKKIGHFLVFDANCPPAGRWRVKAPSLHSTSPLWTFVLNHPGAGKTYGASYPAQTTFIHHGSLRLWVEAPEINKLIATTDGTLTPGGEAGQTAMAWAVNPLSYDYRYPVTTADPASPDYLRREVAAMVYDPALGGFEQLAEFVRNAANVTFHARLWCSFVAPFWPVTDPDPRFGHLRPAHPYDEVVIAGYPAWVRSCNPEIGDDNYQDAHYTALFDTGSIPA